MDEQIHQDERSDIHEDIEKIRQVLQTGGDLHSSEDGVSNPVHPIGVVHVHGQDTAGSSSQQEQPSMTFSEENVEEDSDAQYNFEDGDEFPATPAMALALNRAYQELMEENLKRIKLVLTHNRERQIQIEDEITESSTSLKEGAKKKLGMTIYAVPYFKDVTGLCPPANEDTLLKKLNKEVDPYEKPSRACMFFKEDGSGLSTETKMLRDAIIEDCRMKLIGPLLSKREILCGKLLQVATDEDQPEVKQEKTYIEEQIVYIKMMPLTELLCSLTDLRGEERLIEEVDWMKIATVDFDGQRTPEELKKNWVHFVHPNINSTKFKADEDSRLVKIAQTHDYRNWHRIADELGTHRTAFQCLQRYQMKLNPCLKTGKWSSEEDDILREVVEQCRLGNGDIDWNNVSFFMEGRSYDHCQQRWNIINPNAVKKRGRWTDEEDMKLMMAVKVFGTQWAKVMKFVPGRTNLQVRERWFNAFQNSRHGSWSYAEDKTIWLHVTKYGPHRWADLARTLPMRSDNSVLLRYKRLKKWNTLHPTLEHMSAESVACFANMNSKKVRLEMGYKDESKHDRQQEQDKVFEAETVMLEEAKRQGVVNKEAKHKPKLRKADRQQLLVKHKLTGQLNHKARDEYSSTIEEDMKNGLYVPRPPPEVENTRHCNKLLNQRVKLQQKLQDQIEKSVVKKTKAQGMKLNRAALEQQVTNILGGHNTTDMSALDKIRLDAVGKMLTVKEILDLSTSIQNKVSKSKKIVKKGKGKTKKINHDDSDGEITDKIWKLISDTSVLSGKDVYRPSEELDGRVSKLMSAALNVDLSESIKTTQRLCAGQVPTSWKSREVYEKRQEMVEANVQKLSQITGMEFSLASTGDEATEIPNNTVTEPIERKYQPRTNIHKDAPASAIYNIPPLPPNRVTIQAFRRLLLHRKKLIQIAGKYHIPASLTTGKPMVVASQQQPTASKETMQGVSVYKVMRAEKTKKNEKLQTEHGGQSFQGYVAKTSQQGEAEEPPVILPSVPVTQTTYSPDVLAVSTPPQPHNDLPSLPRSTPSTSSENPTQTSDGIIIEISQEEPKPQKNQSNLEDVIEPIPDFVQGNEHAMNVTAESIDPRVHIAELGRFRPEDLLLAKSIAREKEINALKRGSMDAERFEHHRIAVCNSVAVPGSRVKPYQSKRKSALDKPPRCLETLRQHHDYSLLNSRFKSLFLWPALLSTVNVGKPLTSVTKGILNVKKKKRSSQRTAAATESNLNSTTHARPEGESGAVSQPALSVDPNSVNKLQKPSTSPRIHPKVPLDQRKRTFSLRSSRRAAQEQSHSCAKKAKLNTQCGTSVLSVEEKAELRRILKDIREKEANHQTTEDCDDAEVLEEAEHLVAMLNNCTNESLNKPTNNVDQQNELEKYVPCIMIDGKLFPLTNPLFKDFITTAKSMSNCHMSNTDMEPNGTNDSNCGNTLELVLNNTNNREQGVASEIITTDGVIYNITSDLDSNTRHCGAAAMLSDSQSSEVIHPVISIQPDNVED